MVFGWQPFLESSFIHDSGDGVCMAILTNFCTALCWRRWSAVQVGHEWPTCVCCEYSRSGRVGLAPPLKTCRCASCSSPHRGEGAVQPCRSGIMPDIFLKSAMRPTYVCSSTGEGAYRRLVLSLKTGRLFVEVGQDPPYVFRGFAKTPRAASNPTSLPQGKECIAVHRKFQTRRAAEDSTRLYGAGFPKKWLRHFLGCPVRRHNTV